MGGGKCAARTVGLLGMLNQAAQKFIFTLEKNYNGYGEGTRAHYGSAHNACLTTTVGQCVPAHRHSCASDRERRQNARFVIYKMQLLRVLV